MSQVLITILSRKDSKGCPGKHTKLMNGKPLIQWTMKQAVKWVRGQVIVSSDDPAVHRLSEKMAIPWIWQEPPPIDFTPKVPAIRHTLYEAEHIYGRSFDEIVDLDATAPLRTVRHIEEAYQLRRTLDVSCVMSVVRDHGSWNCLKRSLRGLRRVVSLPSGTDTRQEAPEWLRANASIYVYKRKFLIRKNVVSPMNGWVEPYVMPDWTGYDVNSESDFELVEFIMKRRLLDV